MDFQANLVIVFFIYGLAFFSMGLAMALEYGRSSLLVETRLLLPLAIFGILHGLHEWLEIIILQSILLDLPIPLFSTWVRMGILVISFTFLVVYGVQVFRTPRGSVKTDAMVGIGFLFGYVVILSIIKNASWENVAIWEQSADTLARYVLAVPGSFLAVPGSFLAGLALYRQANQPTSFEHPNLANKLRWAAWGFALYGLTQLFVSPSNFFPANIINVDKFLSATGLPIQVVRAATAILIMVSLIRATQITEKERQNQLLAVQNERLDALQRVQDELVKREVMRQELLKHIVIAQEDERGRISRELHDETAQTLSAFGLTLGALRQRIADQPILIDLIDKLQTLSNQMSSGIYRLVHDLRPTQLDDLGLIPAIQHLTSEDQRYSDLKVNLMIEGERLRMDPFVETVLFRVVQEALNNVKRNRVVSRGARSLK
jgi:signal transduction histidine kinase